jgi:hypothetical protein
LPACGLKISPPSLDQEAEVIGIVGISRTILAGLTAAAAALLVMAAAPASASTGHYAQCTEVSGVWVLGTDANGYMCAVQFRAGGGVAYLRMTGETGKYTWYRVSSSLVSATGTQIPVSSPNVVYVGVRNSHPYLLIPGKQYAYDSTGTYNLLRTSGGTVVLKLATNGLASKFPITRVAPPGTTTQIAWG